MTEQDYIGREIFAYYGRTMYLAQSVEKGFMNVILLNQLGKSITKTRYDEILDELSQLTFGQLKRKLKENNIFPETELNLLNDFHKKRDFLAHSFWWERAVEFYDTTLQYKLLKELDDYTVFFESINQKIEIITDKFILENNIDLENIQQEIILQGKTVPFETFRKLKKNESVLDFFGYKNSERSLIPIFKIEGDTYWTICEIGLTQYKFEIIPENIVRLEVIDKENIFPINQFNPRPKIDSSWNYKLDLKKKGLIIKISKKDILTPFQWEVAKKHKTIT